MFFMFLENFVKVKGYVARMLEKFRNNPHDDDDDDGGVLHTIT